MFRNKKPAKNEVHFNDLEYYQKNLCANLDAWKPVRTQIEWYMMNNKNSLHTKNCEDVAIDLMGPISAPVTDPNRPRYIVANETFDMLWDLIGFVLYVSVEIQRRDELKRESESLMEWNIT